MRGGKKHFSRRPDWRVSDGGGWGRLFFRSRIQEEAQSETGKKFKKCSNQLENGTVREKRLREVEHKCAHVEYNSTKKAQKEIKTVSEVGFEPTPTEVDCDLNAAP